MDIVAHRINLISELLELPVKYGCEIDIRSRNSKLILNHEPYVSGDSLVDYLDNYKYDMKTTITKFIDNNNFNVKLIIVNFVSFLIHLNLAYLPKW